MSSFRQLMMKKKNGQILNPLIKIVGSPTITSDFIYKNVSATDYIYINEILPLSTANSWKIKFKMKYKRNSLSSELGTPTPLIGYYGNNSNDGKSPVLRTDYQYGSNYIRVLISRVGYSNWNINVNLGNYIFVEDNEYYIEFGFNGAEYYVKDLLTNTTLWSKSSSYKCQCSNYISLFHNGWFDKVAEICEGEMDLKSFEVYTNDSLYLSAVI